MSKQVHFILIGAPVFLSMFVHPFGHAMHVGYTVFGDQQHLAKEISSTGWSQFLGFIQYKLERRGGLFLKVDRWFPSSKLCTCGYKNTGLKSQRYWICPKCHTLHDRDDNAVDNLRKEGLRLLAEKGIRVA